MVGGNIWIKTIKIPNTHSIFNAWPNIQLSGVLVPVSLIYGKVSSTCPKISDKHDLKYKKILLINTNKSNNEKEYLNRKCIKLYVKKMVTAMFIYHLYCQQVYYIIIKIHVFTQKVAVLSD